MNIDLEWRRSRTNSDLTVQIEITLQKIRSVYDFWPHTQVAQIRVEKKCDFTWLGLFTLSWKKSDPVTYEQKNCISATFDMQSGCSLTESLWPHFMRENESISEARDVTIWKIWYLDYSNQIIVVNDIIPVFLIAVQMSKKHIHWNNFMKSCDSLIILKKRGKQLAQNEFIL